MRPLVPRRIVALATVALACAAASAGIASDSASAEPIQANFWCLGNGVCVDASHAGLGLDRVAVKFIRFPRVGDYVTKYYNVRDVWGFQHELHPPFAYFEMPTGDFRSRVWSVQACRKLTLRSRCTGWSQIGNNWSIPDAWVPVWAPRDRYL
jgi:hypothetical protein